MKRTIIILLLAVSATTLKAQEQTFTQMFDSVFQYVSRADATTGILYNRVIPFSNLTQFSGNNPDTVDMYRFLYGFHELYNAAFDTINFQSPPLTLKI